MNAAVAAVQFALETDDGMSFLRLWNEGEFDVIRKEWPDAPITVFTGADPMLGDMTEGMLFKIVEPTDEDRLEMSGRLYEACDVIKAIEDGQLTSTGEILQYLRENTNKLSGMLKLDEWLLKIDCHYDFKASFEHATKSGYTITNAFNPEDPDSEKLLPDGSRELAMWGVTPLSTYKYYMNQ